MDRWWHRQDRIIDLLREAQRHLSQGESLASVCKSLGISQSSYRRWRVKYGQRVEESAAPVDTGNTEQSVGDRPSPTENLVSKVVEASPGGKAPKLSEEASELLESANGASDPARNAWLAFLALLTYLLVALGGVSHKDLLLNSPVKLPIVNVDIPLFSFFQYAPVLLLLVYLSLLIQHVMLARKYRKFAEAIAPYEKETQTAHSARELVHSYVVSQILAGPKPNMITSWLMRLMVFVTFTLLPVVTLLYFQITFLPYHEIWITYWHRIAVLLCLAMLFAVLPIIHLKSRKREVKVGPQGEAWQASPYEISFGAVFGILVVVFSWLIATVPDERLDHLTEFVSPKDLNDRPNRPNDQKLLNPLVRFVFKLTPQGDNEDEGWLLPWLLSSRLLVVEDTDLVPDESDKQDEVSVVLRKRDLRFARLNRSDLHRADLTNADLRGAQMLETRLEKAKLQRAQLQGAELGGAQLQGADLTDAQLQDASLGGTNLQRAVLYRAQLQRAYLTGDAMQGADLSGAQLQGADLNSAHLQDADLSGARLQGAYLIQANLQGADLTVAKLQGAWLTSAQLQGADLYQAELQGADLKAAQLQGADLGGAQLQGADLTQAQLQGADLTDGEVWLANFDLANQSPIPLGLADLKMLPPTVDARATLRRELQADVTDDKLLKGLLDSLNPILRDDPPKWADEERWSRYVTQAKGPSPDELVQFLAGMACGDPEGHIANGIARRAIFSGHSQDEGTRHYAKSLVKALLNETCKGAKALTDDMRAGLENLGSATE
jgi:uncharacterized protein YjbI with pentapeptide repeats/transposase-like protein